MGLPRNMLLPEEPATQLPPMETTPGKQLIGK
jgi:hypothetical protein